MSLFYGKNEVKGLKDPTLRMAISYKQIYPNIPNPSQISIHAGFLNLGSVIQGHWAMTQWFSTGGDFAYQGTFDNT